MFSQKHKKAGASAPRPTKSVPRKGTDQKVRQAIRSLEGKQMRQRQPSSASRARPGEQKQLSSLRSSTTTSVPLAMSHTMTSSFAQPGRDRWRSVGREYLTSITVPTGGYPTGSVLAALTINPSDFPGSRLSVLARLYDMYSIKRLVVTYEPAVSTITPGQVCGYFDRDVKDAFQIASETNIRSAACNPTFKAGAVWSPMQFVLYHQKDLTVLYTDTESVDPHWTDAGLFQFLAATLLPSHVEGPYTLGTLYLDYDIEFYNPQLEVSGNWNGGSMLTGGGTYSPSTPFGSTPIFEYNGLGLELPTGTNYLTLAPGSYQIFFQNDYSEAVNIADYPASTFTTTSDGPLSPDLYNMTSLTSTLQYNGWFTIHHLDSAIRYRPGGSAASTAATTFLRIFVNPIPPPSSALSRLINPAMLGSHLQARSWMADLKRVDWKLPVNLIKKGIDFLDSHGWTGRLSPYTRGFSKLLGYLLHSGLLGSSDLSDLPQGLLDLWASQGFRTPRSSSTTSASSTPPFVVVEEEDVKREVLQPSVDRRQSVVRLK